jgi:hypothetical protein
MQSAKMDLSGIKTASTQKLPSEEDLGKAYLESMVMLPALIDAMVEKLDLCVKQVETCAATLSVIALYFEKKGIKDGLITSDELTEENDG